MINVEGDAIGAGIVAHLSRKELEAMSHDEQLKAADTGFDEADIPYTTDYPAEEKLKPPQNGDVNPAFFFNAEELNTEL